MYTGKILFAQLMDFLPWTTFTRIVTRYRGDHRVRTLSCTEQFRCMAFAQLTYRESLRDIEACLSEPNRREVRGIIARNFCGNNRELVELREKLKCAELFDEFARILTLA